MTPNKTLSCLVLSKLESGRQEINSKEIRPHFTFAVNWNKRDKV